jgi:hypothetical protein
MVKGTDEVGPWRLGTAALTRGDSYEFWDRSAALSLSDGKLLERPVVVAFTSGSFSVLFFIRDGRP